MFVIGGILSQIGISLVMAIENNIMQIVAGVIFFGLPIATFLIVFFLSLSTDYS